MPRSVKLRPDVIGKVQTIFHNNFFCQKDLADEAQVVSSTISNFLNGKPIDRRKFQEICDRNERKSYTWNEEFVTTIFKIEDSRVSEAC